MDHRPDTQGSLVATRKRAGMATPAFLLDLSNVSPGTADPSDTDKEDLSDDNFCQPCTNMWQHGPGCTKDYCSVAGCSKKVDISDNPAETIEFHVERDMKHLTQKLPEITKW